MKAYESVLHIEWDPPVSSKEVICYELHFILENEEGSVSGYVSPRKLRLNRIKETPFATEEIEHWVIVSDSIKTNSHVVNYLESAKNYKFRVRARCAEGYSAFTVKSCAFKTKRRL